MYSNASIKDPTADTSYKSAFKDSIKAPTLQVKKSSFSHVNDIVGLEGPLYLSNKPKNYQLVAKRADLAKNLIKQQQKNYLMFSEYENMGKRAESITSGRKADLIGVRKSLDYGHDSARAQQKRNTTLQTANMAEKLLKKSLQKNVRSIQSKKSSLRPHVKKDDKLLVI